MSDMPCILDTAHWEHDGWHGYAVICLEPSHRDRDCLGEHELFRKPL